MQPSAPIPIPTLHLFEKLDRKLIELLRSLDAGDWSKPTLAKKWTVKDIAAHLLDGNIRSVSIIRDGFFGDPPDEVSSYSDLVKYLNRLNADWVTAMKRVSPQALVDLLEKTHPAYVDMLKALDPFAAATFPVDWAGEDESKNWFHIAREYTEKWHHQQQIRQAVGKAGVLSREFYFPVLDTFMRALPHTYRNTQAAWGTVVNVVVTGEAGGAWQITREQGGWVFGPGVKTDFSAEVQIPQDIAWKLFTKGIDPAEAKKQLIFKGNEELGRVILSMISVMA